MKSVASFDEVIEELEKKSRAREPALDLDQAISALKGAGEVVVKHRWPLVALSLGAGLIFGIVLQRRK